MQHAIHQVPRPISGAAIACIVVVLLTIGFPGSLDAQCAETILLRTGNGAIGAPDASLHGLTGGPFNAVFTPSDFQAARTGPAPFVVAPYTQWNGGSLPGYPAANWVAIQPDLFGGSALFAQDFMITTTPVAAATLSITFAVDNYLGNATNQGLFLNGTPVPGFPAGSIGAFSMPYQLGPYDLTGLVVPGLNTLYVHMHNPGFVSGLIYGCAITVHPASSAASVAAFGESCSPGGSQQGPLLSMSLPIQGQSTVLSVTSAPAGSIGILVYDAPQPSYPTFVLPGGCEVYVSLAGALILTTFAAPSGWWFNSIPVPAAPQLAGVTAILQAALLLPSGVVTTNALSVVIGC